MATGYVPPRIEDNANLLQERMRLLTRNVFTILNDSVQPELRFDANLFIEPVAGLLSRSYTAAEQPILIAKQISELVKGIARDNRRDPQIANYVATILATLAGITVETLEFQILALIDISAVVNPVPGLDFPRTPVSVIAQQPGFNRVTYEEQLGIDISTLRHAIFTDLTSKLTIIREVHMNMLIESISSRIIHANKENPVLRQFIAEDLMPLIIRIIGHVFSTEGPFIVENLRRIYVLSTAQPFDRNAAQKAGVIKFTGGPSELQRLSADNLDDLNQYSQYPLEAINAYAYWKLLLYAPPQAWEEVKWMKNLVSSVPPQWWENPATRFDFFINAWILDTLSRVGELKANQTLGQKIAYWKTRVRLPAGVKGKIAISGPLLAEISLFDAFFKIDYQMIFPEANARLDINPFRFLLDDEIGDEFITAHFLQGIMIDCAKRALCIHVRESATVRANRMPTYNGIAVAPSPAPILSDKRVDLRGLRFFLDFVDEKFLTPRENLGRSSVNFFALTEVMGTFINYVSIYAFHNGFPPDGRRRVQWTADRSPILTGGGRRGRRPEYQALLTYLDELRTRVVNNQPLCNTTPNVYLDIPISLHEPAPAPGSAGGGGPASASPGGGGPAVVPVAAASADGPAVASAPPSRHVVFADPSLAPPRTQPQPTQTQRPPQPTQTQRPPQPTQTQRPPQPTGLSLGGFSKSLPTTTTPLLSRPQPLPQPSPQQRRPAGSDPGGLSVAGDPAQGVPVFSAGARTGLRSELVSRRTADINTLLAEYRGLQQMVQDNPTDIFRDALARARLAYAEARRAYESAGRDVSAYPDPGRAS